MSSYTVAVRELAEFCHRRGDIDYRFTPSPTGAEGIAGHRRVTRSRAPGYRPEYAVEGEWSLRGVTLKVRGRADGYDPVEGLVEEIKTCRVDPELIPDAVESLHWAQALLYGALLCEQEQRDGLQVRLTYWNVDTETERQRQEWVSVGALSVFLRQTLERHALWLERLSRLETARNESIRALAFPYGEYRSGQRDMAESVYKCIVQRGQLLLQAPTGIGKTAGVLFPAIKALAEDRHQALVYLTARTVGRRAAEDTLSVFAASGLKLRSLSLTSKDSACLSPGKACHGDDCPYARGYYDRLPDAMAEATTRGQLTRESLEMLAREHEICPYQLAMDMVPWVDAIIADLHYVYSFFGMIGHRLEARGAAYSVLIDEAHNLPERARAMYSAALAKRDVVRARKQAGGGLRRALDALNRRLLALQKESWQEADFDSRREWDGKLSDVLSRLVREASCQMAEDPGVFQRSPDLLDFYFSVLQFQRVLDVFGDHYRFERHRGRGPQGLRLVLNCLEPAGILMEKQKQPCSVTAFSATVSPPEWVAPALGFSSDAVYVSLPSPFASEQLSVVVDTRVDTRYRSRDMSLSRLCEAIASWLRDTPGNCIVYFPAYRYMQDVLQVLEAGLPGRTLFVQQPDQGEERRAELLALFQQRTDLAAFCILGGVFGEGIDLPGDALSSVVVVGVGLPRFDREREVLREYFQEVYGRGFEYAYLYPGLLKVNQALGRVVRRPSDRGRALLLDSRYRDPAYRSLLPPWWDYRDSD